jgi:hypothetical protein
MHGLRLCICTVGAVEGPTIILKCNCELRAPVLNNWAEELIVAPHVIGERGIGMYDCGSTCEEATIATHVLPAAIDAILKTRKPQILIIIDVCQAMILLAFRVSYAIVAQRHLDRWHTDGTAILASVHALSAHEHARLGEVECAASAH